jgi:hypothetical protein
MLDSAPARATQPGRTTGPQEALAAAPAAFDMSSLATAAMVSSTTEPVDRKAVGVVGWFLLALLIVGCAAVIVFVALNERDKAREPIGTSASGAIGSGNGTGVGSQVVPQVVPQPQGSGAVPVPVPTPPKSDGSGSAGGSAEKATGSATDKTDKDKTDKDKTDKDKTDKNKKNDPKSGTGKKNDRVVETPTKGEPASDAEARAILDQADAMKAANRLTEAYAAYGQVANGKFRKGQGYLGQALVKIANKDFKEGARLAGLAMKFGGGVRATITRAAAVRRTGDAQLAIQYYEKALADAGGNKAIVDEARIALDKLAKDCPSCKFAKKPSPAPRR